VFLAKERAEFRAGAVELVFGARVALKAFEAVAVSIAELPPTQSAECGETLAMGPASTVHRPTSMGYTV